MPRLVSPRGAAIAAASLFAAAVIGFGALFPAFSQLSHPVAALGARGLPRAVAFDVVGFVLPGLLAAGAAFASRRRFDDAGFAARLGVAAIGLAGLAFVGQGVSPLDARDLYAASSRLHAALWTFWWLAFAVGAALLAIGAWRSSTRGVAIAVFACALSTLVCALVLPAVVPVGLAQRIAFASWFVALILVAPGRRAVSGRRSPRTGRAG